MVIIVLVGGYLRVYGTVFLIILRSWSGQSYWSRCRRPEANVHSPPGSPVEHHLRSQTNAEGMGCLHSSPDDQLQQTAFLGCAAVDMSGATGAVHQCSGVSTAQSDPPELPGSAPSQYRRTASISHNSFAIRPPMLTILGVPRVAPRHSTASARSSNSAHRSGVLRLLARILV